MAHKLLVAVDGSETGKRVINYAVASIRATTSSIVLAYIIEWSPYNILTPREVAERQQKRESEIAGVEESILASEADELRAVGVDVETVVRHGNIGETLSQIARDYAVSQIFIGRKAESRMQTMLFGSVTASLIQTSPVAVTVVP